MECTIEFGTSGVRAYQPTKCEQGSKKRNRAQPVHWAKSLIRIAVAPMPIAPAVAPVTAVPAPAASLADQPDRRWGAEFGGCRFRGRGRSALSRDAHQGYQTSVAIAVRISASIEDRWPECCTTND